ncbi:class C sortase [uncultured Subdoligranulum sp.]|uniref:class C sortase n=1 Tax=uncultured Subdoligranulum sp. TaxID=512298 RepID=UPI0025EDB26E|nr:class C sortase [uncultured Subdoligranulum sp.]
MQLRSIAPIAAALTLFLGGAAVFCYPAISNYLNQKNQTRVVQHYEQTVAAQDDALLAEEWAKAEEYNENLAGDPVHDPFVPGSGYALPDNYLDVLNIDGVMGRITIPKIGVDLPIYHGTDAETLEKGVGHIESTSLPIGGEYRHAVLTGHRGLPSAELFTRLDELEPGDQFYLHVLDATLAYQVDQILTVEPQELETLVAETGQDYVTLVTCTPYGINTHRMLVRGTRIPYVPEAEQSTQATAAHLLGGETTTRYFLIGILFGIGLLYLFIAVLLGYRLLHSTAKGENHHA